MATTKKTTTKKAKATKNTKKTSTSSNKATKSTTKATKSTKKATKETKSTSSTSPKATTKPKAKPKKAPRATEIDKFAVIEVNSTQLMVHEGGKYEIDRIEGEKGDKMSISEVLLIADKGKVSVGKPYVDGAKVELVIDSQKKGKKMRVFKYKAKSRYRRTYGHRDQITRLEVKSIKA